MQHRFQLNARFAALVGRRFVEDNCPSLAASLTYTTLLSLVPLATIALTLITAFPVFKEFTQGVDDFFAHNLLPPSVAKTVTGYIEQFTQSAARLTALGIAFLALTAIMLMQTIERAFNVIWRVRRQRPLVFRVLTYWGVLTLGPLLIGLSVTMTSYLVGASLGYARQIPGGAPALFGLVSFLFAAVAFTLTYYVVPNRPVEFKHALIGGLAAAAMFELMKRGFALYVARFPSYTMVYGAFAAAPIFLLWLYLCWVVALLGAVIAATLPDLRAPPTEALPPGAAFRDALGILRVLIVAQRGSRAPNTREICAAARVPYPTGERLLEAMVATGWVARVVGDRWALACDPELVSIGEIYRRLVFEPKQSATDAVFDGVIERVAEGIDRALAEPISSLAPDAAADARRSAADGGDRARRRLAS